MEGNLVRDICEKLPPLPPAVKSNPKNKHKLVVVESEWPDYVKLECEFCVAGIMIERPVWKLILCEGDRRLEGPPVFYDLECRGR